MSYAVNLTASVCLHNMETLGHHEGVTKLNHNGINQLGDVAKIFEIFFLREKRNAIRCFVNFSACLFLVLLT